MPDRHHEGRQEADGPSLLAISRDRTDVRSTECTDPSRAPSGSRQLHEPPVDREPRLYAKGLERLQTTNSYQQRHRRLA